MGWDLLFIHLNQYLNHLNFKGPIVNRKCRSIKRSFTWKCVYNSTFQSKVFSSTKFKLENAIRIYVYLRRKHFAKNGVKGTPPNQIWGI